MRVGDVAKQLGASPEAVRKWTDEGLIKCSRSPYGHRFLASGIPVIFVSAKDTSAKCAHDGAELKQRRAEKPPAVKLGAKQRNGWRSVDRKSGLRDAVIKHEIVEKSSKCKSKTNEFSVPFPEVESRHEEKASTVLRGAFWTS